MEFLVVQFLTGLASASSLFLVASGLSIIFGVTRIVNFAHGAFYMLGAYVAFTLTERFSGAIGFWGGIVAAALIVAVIGVLVEMVLLRRIYHAPELFQLLATFGLTLMVEDLVVLIWGPSDLLGRRGQVQGQDDRDDMWVINAMVPLANMFGYVNTLRSMSQGRAQYSMEFHHYEPVPANVAEEIKKKVA